MHAAEVVSDDATAEETRNLEAFNTKLMLAQIEPSYKSPSLSRLGPRPSIETVPWFNAGLLWRSAVSVCVLVLLILVVKWRVAQVRTPSVEQLLAEAYADHRNVQLRIVGAKYAPAPMVSLGGDDLSKSHTEQSSNLLTAEALISDRLKATPDDVRWLHAKGQADILEGNFSAAVSSLQRAHQIDQNNELISVDLATAAYGNGNYEESLNVFRKVTHANPNNQVAWFNLALTCERLQLLTEALRAWNSYLRLDPEPGWSEEARKHKGDLERLLIKPTGQVIPDPQTAIALQGKSNDTADEQIEEYLDIAVSNWLPQITNLSSGTTALAASVAVAKIAASRHGDKWLQDIIADSQKNGRMQNALLHLADAIQQNRSGNYGKAVKSAQFATARFKALGSAPGVLRATFEKIYAYHLSQHGESCFSEAGPLIEKAKEGSYAWLEIQTTIERAICANMTDRIDQAKVGADLALKIALYHRSLLSG
jgi:tetratricopeptide (TPR) repeat protein